MGTVPALLNHQLVSKKLGKSYGGKRSLISPARLWSSLGNRIWKHRFSKLGELGSALERRHTDCLAPGETGGPARPGAHRPPGVYKTFVVLAG